MRVEAIFAATPYGNWRHTSASMNASTEGALVGVHYDPSRRKYTVRSIEDGRRRIRRFEREADALEFADRNTPPDNRIAASAPSPAARAANPHGDGIYRYETKDGPRWRFVFIQSDGDALLVRTPTGAPSRSAVLAAVVPRARTR
jgi:hypothetical protein